MDVLLPQGWAPPVGYANGVAAAPGRIVFVAGQVGWDEQQKFASADLVPQFEQALKNVLAVVAAAGGKPRARLPHDRLLLRQARLSRPRARSSGGSGAG